MIKSASDEKYNKAGGMIPSSPQSPYHRELGGFTNLLWVFTNFWSFSTFWVSLFLTNSEQDRCIWALQAFCSFPWERGQSVLDLWYCLTLVAKLNWASCAVFWINLLFYQLHGYHQGPAGVTQLLNPFISLPNLNENGYNNNWWPSFEAWPDRSSGEAFVMQKNVY